MDNDISKNFLGKKLNSSHLGEIIPEQDKNKKTKISKENIGQGITVPASSTNNSNIENRPAKDFDKRNKVLNYLGEHKNDNSYSQGISYLQEVREKITSILKNKGLLDEELIDELYNACLIKECSTKEDRKIEGNVIIEVAKKIRDKREQVEKNIKLNGVKKNNQIGNLPQRREKNLNSEKVKDSSKLKESYDDVLKNFRRSDLGKSIIEINGKIIGENYEIKAVKSGDIQSKGKNSDKRVTFDDLTGVSVLPFYDMPCDKNNVNSTFAIPKEEALSKKERIDFTDKNRSENKKLIEARIRNRTKKTTRSKGKLTKRMPFARYSDLYVCKPYRGGHLTFHRWNTPF